MGDEVEVFWSNNQTHWKTFSKPSMRTTPEEALTYAWMACNDCVESFDPLKGTFIALVSTALRRLIMKAEMGRRICTPLNDSSSIEDYHDILPSPEYNLSNNIDIGFVKETMRIILTEKQLEVINYRLEGYGFTQMSIMLNVSTQACHQRYQSGLKKLKEFYYEEDY